MAHKWQPMYTSVSTVAKQGWEPRRQCLHCGVIQQRESDHAWMRVTGYRWRPLAGRCHPLQLTEMDIDYYRSIANGYMVCRAEADIYHVVDHSKQILGVIGSFIDSRARICSAIAIDPQHRSKGLLSVFYAIFMQHKQLDTIYAHIHDNNIASMKSHTRSGFVHVSTDWESSVYRYKNGNV